MNTRNSNLTIALLLATTAMLTAVMVTTINDTAQTAQAATGVSQSRGGQYIMVPGAVSDSYDMVYVIDIVADRINAYIVNPNNQPIDQKGTQNLGLLFK